MLAVLGAVDAGYNTLVLIAAATGLDKKTVTVLLSQATEQAMVAIQKDGAMYRIEAWGPVFKRAGAKMALQGALKAPIIEA